jgi:hypothetical protein
MLRLEEDNEFFAELFTKPEPVEYGHHPSDRLLQTYLAGRLGDEWHFSPEFLPRLRRADLNGDWGLSEVSLHLLTCNLCCERVVKLRAEELAAFERERSLLPRLWSRARRRLSLDVLLGWNCRVAQRFGSFIAASFSPLALDLTLGTYVISPVGLGFFYQRLRSGLEFHCPTPLPDRSCES